MSAVFLCKTVALLLLFSFFCIFYCCCRLCLQYRHCVHCLILFFSAFAATCVGRGDILSENMSVQKRAYICVSAENIYYWSCVLAAGFATPTTSFVAVKPCQYRT